MVIEKRIEYIGEEKQMDASSFIQASEKIDSLIEWLQDRKTKGATHIDIGGSSDYDGDIEEVIFQAFKEYIETPSQKKERIQIELNEQQVKERKQLLVEMDMYQRLKKKFESNT